MIFENPESRFLFTQTRSTSFTPLRVGLLQVYAIATATDSISSADWLLTVPEALQNLDAPNLDEDWYFTMDVVEQDGHQIVYSDRHCDKYQTPRLISVDALRLTTQFQQEQGVHVLYKLQSDATGNSVFVKSFDVPSVATFSDYKRAAAEPTSE